MRTLLLSAIVIAAAVGAAVVLRSHASTPGQIALSGSSQTVTPVQTSEEALLADAAEIARGQGISTEEAARRIRAQAVLGDHLARLREAHRDRVAGIFYENEPDFRVVVRLKGRAPPRANPLNESPVDSVPIEFRTGAAFTLDELLASAERYRADITSIEGLQGYSPDERTGEIVLDVYAPGREAETRLRVAELGRRMRVPLEVFFVPAPVSEQ